MKKPKVGQTLYSLNIGNAARGVEQELTTTIVTKVGRKYFYCTNGLRYYIESWYEKSNYSPRSKLFETPQGWEDEKEVDRIALFISACFDYSTNRKNLSLDKLQKIEKIIIGGE